MLLPRAITLAVAAALIARRGVFTPEPAPLGRLLIRR